MVFLFLSSLWSAFVLHIFCLFILFGFWSWVIFIYFSFLFPRYFFPFSFFSVTIFDCLGSNLQLRNQHLAGIPVLWTSRVLDYFFLISMDVFFFFIQGHFLARNVLQICWEDICIEISCSRHQWYYSITLSDSPFINPVCTHAVFERSSDK